MKAKQTIKLKYKPHPKQKEAHMCTEPYILFGGAVGGGKSVCGVNDMLQCSLDFRKNRVGIFRWRSTSFKISTMETVKEWILSVPGLVVSHNKTDRVITLFNESQIIYGGLMPSQTATGDLNEITKSLELSAVFLDEVTDFPESVFDFLLGRIPRWKAIENKSGKLMHPPKRIFASCNPELGWVKSRWVDKQVVGYKFFPSKVSDNPSNQKDYEADLRRDWSDEDVRRLVDGDWSEIVNAQSVFPAKWLMASQKNNMPIGEQVSLGVDVATYHGGDKSVVVLRRGMKADILGVFKGLNTVDITSAVAGFANEYEPDEINVDGIGVGEGVCDQLEEMGYPVERIVGSETPYNDMFLNRRAEIYWNVRNLLEAGLIGLPDDSDLINQMGTITYIRTDGKIQIQSKKEIRKKEGKSPDLSDGLIYAFANAGSPYVISAMV